MLKNLPNAPLAVLGIALMLYIVGKTYMAKPVEIMTVQDFTGDYYLSNGLSIIWHLTIMPDQDFILQLGSDLGSADEYTGSIVITNGQVLLSTPENGRFMPQTLIPVQWGQRQYLILMEDLTTFCEWRSKGLEPRKTSWGSVAYLRMNDWNLPAEGQPITLDGISLCR
jgi:hypothetical protein